MTSSLARRMHDLAREHPNWRQITHNLSITTLRYVPLELRASIGSEQTEAYLNRLNQLVLTHLENGGEAFCSNALIGGKYRVWRFSISVSSAQSDSVSRASSRLA